MIAYSDINDYLLSFDGTHLEYPFGDDVAVYKYGQADDGQMFALVDKFAKPLRISLRCDPQLAKTLRDTYESVQPGINLNRRNWNTIICTGQLDDEQIKDLARHSYQVVSATD